MWCRAKPCLSSAQWRWYFLFLTKIVTFWCMLQKKCHPEQNPSPDASVGIYKFRRSDSVQPVWSWFTQNLSTYLIFSHLLLLKSCSHAAFHWTPWWHYDTSEALHRCCKAIPIKHCRNLEPAVMSSSFRAIISLPHLSFSPDGRLFPANIQASQFNLR